MIATEAARAAADAAAQAAGVSVVEVADPADHSQVAVLLNDVWQAEPDGGHISASVVRALSFTGCYVAAALAGTAMVGATVGMFAADGHLHSHITGVVSGRRSRGVGFALKLHQRAWALERGGALISWTFDPLVLRNAWFNLRRLGAAVVDYLPDFYGAMSDGVNAGDDSDRLLVHWHLDAPIPEPGEPTERLPTFAAVDIADGRPVVHDLPAGVDSVRVAVPRDIEAIRGDDLDLARSWRLAVRQAMSVAFQRGLACSSVSRGGWYLLERPTPGETA